jgi:aminopeptidase
MELKIANLAKKILNYSCQVREKERVLIDYEGEPAKRLVKRLIKDIYELGAFPYITSRDSEINREIMLGCSEAQLDYLKKIKLAEAKIMNTVIVIRSLENKFELTDVPPEKLNLYMKSTGPIKQYRINKQKWILMHYPSAAMAQKAKMSREAFENFFFSVCLMDYDRLAFNMNSLEDIMKKTDKVSIIGPGTNLEFSIKNMPIVKCCGHNNLPDGEIYTAPIVNTVNGRVSFNVPATELGTNLEEISLVVKAGEVIEATANNSAFINKILDRDLGARYFGEFAIGLNPRITSPIGDVMFDEKILGSFHLALGNSYKNAFNGNKSDLHCDFISIQTPDYGGGEIWFDDMMIQKNGHFVLPSLLKLNAEK